MDRTVVMSVIRTFVSKGEKVICTFYGIKSGVLNLEKQ